MRFLLYGATKGRGDGIGRSVALTLLSRGHEVRALCRSEQKACDEQELSLEVLDLCAEVGRNRLKELIRAFDPDVVWSACGTGHSTPLWSMPDGEIEEMLDANVRNNILFCRTCAPSCIDGGPHLVLTGSVAGVLDGVGAAVYSGTKGFLVPFVRGQRAEYKRQGHKPKISLLMLHSVRHIGIEAVADALEFVAKQSCSVEVMLT